MEVLEGCSQHHAQVDIFDGLEYRLPLGKSSHTRITVIQWIPVKESNLNLRARSFCNPENPRIFKVKDLRKHVVVNIGLTMKNRVCIYLWVSDLD